MASKMTEAKQLIAPVNVNSIVLCQNINEFDTHRRLIREIKELLVHGPIPDWICDEAGLRRFTSYTVNNKISGVRSLIILRNHAT